MKNMLQKPKIKAALKRKPHPDEPPLAHTQELTAVASGLLYPTLSHIQSSSLSDLKSERDPHTTWADEAQRILSHSPPKVFNRLDTLREQKTKSPKASPLAQSPKFSS